MLVTCLEIGKIYISMIKRRREILRLQGIYFSYNHIRNIGPLFINRRGLFPWKMIESIFNKFMRFANPISLILPCYKTSFATNSLICYFFPAIIDDFLTKCSILFFHEISFHSLISGQVIFDGSSYFRINFGGNFSFLIFILFIGH